MKSRVFTQTSRVSHEAWGLRRSRPTGSSSQTRSEEETVKKTVNMTSYGWTQWLDIQTRGQCWVGGGQIQWILIQEGLDVISLLIFVLSHESKLKWSDDVPCNFDQPQMNVGAERCKSLHFSWSAGSGETHVGQVRGGRKENKWISLFGLRSRKANTDSNKLVTNTGSIRASLHSVVWWKRRLCSF